LPKTFETADFKYFGVFPQKLHLNSKFVGNYTCMLAKVIRK